MGKCSKLFLGIYKKSRPKPVILMVDPGNIFWNPFFEIIIKWYPILKEINAK